MNREEKICSEDGCNRNHYAKGYCHRCYDRSDGTRVKMNISFPNEDDKQSAIKKSKQRDRTVSQEVQRHFKKMRNLEG